MSIHLSDVTHIRGDHGVIDTLRRLVTEAGGHWIGVQESLLGESWKILFINPTTHRQLLIGFNPITFDSHTAPDVLAVIIARLSEDTAEFENRHVSVKVTVLKGIAKNLMDAAAELEALYDRREK